MPWRRRWSSGLGRLMLFRIGKWLPAACIIAAIWFLSSQSTLPQIKGIVGWDKLQHLIAYLALAAALGLWFSPARWQSRPLLCLLVAGGLASVYGVIDEIHQYFVPGRDCNIWDWIADTLGAFLGAVLIMFVLRAIYKKRNAA